MRALRFGYELGSTGARLDRPSPQLWQPCPQSCRTCLSGLGSPGRLLQGRRTRAYFRIGHSGHSERNVMGYSDLAPAVHERRPWNAGQNVGPKRPLKPRDIWAIRFYLDEHRRLRDRALFDLAIDSKLRGCDLVKLKIGDVVSGGDIRNRATVIQQKTGKPVQFEIMSEARKSLTVWLGDLCAGGRRLLKTRRLCVFVAIALLRPSWPKAMPTFMLGPRECLLCA